MMLYHLIAHQNPIIETLRNNVIHPAVPHHRLPGEDTTIPRICVATSLDGCLSALGPCRVVCNISAEHKCARYACFAFDSRDIAPEHILTSQRLMEMHYLPDALLTGECWLTTSCRPRSVFDLMLVDFEMNGTGRLYVDGEKMQLWTLQRSRWTQDADRVELLLNREAYRKLILVAKKTIQQMEVSA